MEMVLSPQVWCLILEVVGETEAVGGSVVVEKVSEEGEGLVMESFGSQEKEFELKLLWGREPGQVCESLFRTLEDVP